VIGRFAIEGALQIIPVPPQNGDVLLKPVEFLFPSVGFFLESAPLGDELLEFLARYATFNLSCGLAQGC
jgi:hypothetical protein